MPKGHQESEEYEEDVSASSAFKSVRRQAQATRRRRSQSGGGGARKARVYVERRRDIDAHKVARALLGIADAVQEAQAQASDTTSGEER